MAFLQTTTNIGIYQITNQVNGKSYVGSSRGVYRRLMQHRSTLTRSAHYNKYLQRSVNIHGIEKFIFRQIAACPVEYLTKLEQWFLDNICNKYNYLKVANSVKGFRHTKEAKRRISIAMKNRVVSEETKEKLRITSAAKRHSDKAKKLIGSYNKKRFSKKVRCINTGETFPSIKEAAASMGLCKVAIGESCLKGRIIREYYRFEYA